MVDEVVEGKTAENEVGIEVVEAEKGAESEGIEELKARILKAEEGRATERAAREEAERRLTETTSERDKAARERQEAASQVVTSRMNEVTSALDSLTREQLEIRNAMKAAAETGDYDKHTDENMKAIEVSRKIAALTQYKEQLTAESKNPQRQQQPTADPGLSLTERYIRSLTPAGAAWIRGKKGAIIDNGQMADASPALKAAHFSALAKGIAVDSADYFAHLDRAFANIDAPTDGVDTSGTVTPEDQGGDVVDIGTARKASPNYSAPPSRSGSAGAPLTPTQVRLTRDQLEAAEIAGMTPKQYAEELVRLKKTGAL